MNNAEDFKYFVDESGGTVIAKFNNLSLGHMTDDEVWTYRVKNLLESFCNKSEALAKIDCATELYDGGNYSDFMDEAKNYLEHIDLYGKAKCSPVDIFDPEAGKKIAREKLLAKYYRFERHMVNYVLERAVKFISDFHIRLLNRSILCAYKIDKYTGEEKNVGKEKRRS